VARCIGLSHVFLLLGSAAPLLGCGGGDGLPRQEVSGQVMLNGQPLADGTIQFQPDPNATSPMVPGGALISGGSYRIRRAEGLVPGTYKVMIFSHGAADEASAAPGAQTGPPPELVPAKYNAMTTLTAEVSKEKPNVLRHPRQPAPRHQGLLLRLVAGLHPPLGRAAGDVQRLEQRGEQQPQRRPLRRRLPV
jgi:hypothetical protein